VLFAIGPLWRMARLEVQAVMQRTTGLSSPPQWLGRPMLALQVAAAIVLVFGTVVAARALLAVLDVDLGLRPENVLTLRVAPGDGDGRTAQAFYLRVLDELGRRPDVVAAGAVSALPLAGAAPDESVRDDTNRMVAGVTYALPGFAEAAGIPVLRGRTLTIDDVRAGDSAVVTESAAKALFGLREPLGESFTASSGRRFTVIGVLGDHRRSVTRADPAQAYVVAGELTRALVITARLRTRNDAAAGELKHLLGRLAPDRPATIEWWEDSVAALTAYRNPRFQTLVFGAFATLALGLASLGVYAVVAVLVVARTREMGVRLAVGATPGGLVALLVRQVMAPVIAGAAIGLLATRGLARLAEAQLFQVQTRDPATLALAAGVVLAAALIAAYVPALRVSRIDASAALRAE
jgi:hypothetical protein